MAVAITQPSSRKNERQPNNSGKDSVRMVPCLLFSEDAFDGRSQSPCIWRSFLRIALIPVEVSSRDQVAVSRARARAGVCGCVCVCVLPN